MKGRAALYLAAAAAAAITACAEKAPVLRETLLADDRPSLQTAASGTVPGAQLYRETGTASWYGREMQGKPTASGERFDMNGLTAAHRTIPLGTVVRVTNLENFKSVNVKVNDRGPFVRSRVMELSYGAAKELGFAAQGSATVRIESVDPLAEGAFFTVHAAAFAEEENARLLKERLNRRFETVAIIPFESNIGRFYRVRVGSYASEEKAERIAGKLILEGLEPLVLRKD
ncbi:MAG: septal ring lytic transglycosylase RlpA family protein [Nitrospirota bacterium]|nr:septal ring lytic transglycosylase RlpA family protein [Nitrospirota bacterium]